MQSSFAMEGNKFTGPEDQNMDTLRNIIWFYYNNKYVSLIGSSMAGRAMAVVKTAGQYVLTW